MRIWIFLAVAFGLAGAGYLQSDSTNQLVLWSIAGAIMGGVAVVRGYFFARSARGRHAGRAIMSFIEYDAAPSFATSSDGKISYQNAASIARLGPQRGISTAEAMSGFIANPDALIARLRAKAEFEGAASEDIARSGRSRRLPARESTAGRSTGRLTAASSS